MAGDGIWKKERETMSEKKKAAGYVKLAKLWEKNRETALTYHNEYYHTKFAESRRYDLYDVYIDITGKKDIKRRPEMLRLISDCAAGRVDCIFAQTKGYLAANNREFIYLTHYLFTMDHRIDIVTEDEQYHIDTVKNEDLQKEAMLKMAEEFIGINADDHKKWVSEIESCMSRIEKTDRQCT